ncbi:unnamed protein product [Allacma fusca]|uniref:Lipase n=1 Tax=Allacma fusca TaxID=39272 RepID=A0A8J2M8F7_9HEXA|nr:unnamed protein product [Allacma fusca]
MVNRLFSGSNDYGSGLPDVTINQAGYPVEVHSVVTPDGYILPVYRIPNSKNGTSTRGPVLLMPGALTSASVFFLLSPEKALPFVLSNAGYDVWVGNYRGCEGTSHKKFSNTEAKFWNFSMDEIAQYDVTSLIDHIQTKTQAPAINYIGYSLGCSVFFMALARQPSYNQKIQKMAGLGPTCYINNTRSFATNFQYLPLDAFVDGTDLLFGGEFPVSRIQESLTSYLEACNLIGNVKGCFDLVLRGMGPSRANMSVIRVGLKHIPSPVSARIVAQMGQIGRSDKCRMYDFGSKGNVDQYGTKNPKLYYLGNVTAQSMGVIGPDDQVVTAQNVNRTFRELGNSKSFTYQVNRSDFTHSDFVFDDEAKSLVYDKVVDFFNSN